MPSASFFAQLGMFVLPRFFDAALCASLRREMQFSAMVPAAIHDARQMDKVDREQRCTAKAQVSDETRAHVMSRLLSQLPKLSDHFGVDLDGCQPLSFLVYEQGAQFARHTDTSSDPNAAQLVRARRVSLCIFLNREGGVNEPDTYTGGALTFYGSVRGMAITESPGLRLDGDEGLLVAFRSDWPHSVSAVHRGVRYSIVTWFI